MLILDNIISSAINTLIFFYFIYFPEPHNNIQRKRALSFILQSHPLQVYSHTNTKPKQKWLENAFIEMDGRRKNRFKTCSRSVSAFIIMRHHSLIWVFVTRCGSSDGQEGTVVCILDEQHHPAACPPPKKALYTKCTSKTSRTAEVPDDFHEGNNRQIIHRIISCGEAVLKYISVNLPSSVMIFFIYSGQKVSFSVR